MHEECGLVIPERIVMGHVLIWKRKNNVPDLVEVPQCAYYVPFLIQLKVLLSIKEIRLQVENPENNVGVYKTVLDGSYYKNHIAVDGENRIGIIFYTDELVVTN